MCAIHRIFRTSYCDLNTSNGTTANNDFAGSSTARSNSMKVGTPRIIGILLIIIAALIYFTGLKGWTGLGVAGIILLIASANYTQKILDKLIAAISDWKTLFI